MAGIKISDLPVGTTILTSSIFPVVTDPSLPPANRVTNRFSVLQLMSLITIVASGRVFQDSFDPPVAPPPDPGSPAVYYPSGGGVLYQWDVGSQAWL